MTYILFFVGFFALIRGAEWLIEGATLLAKKLGVSELIIGLTVVAFGTSLPELVVNLFANTPETSEIAIGNVLGSNIANILLILGVAAIIHPLTVHRTTVYREIVFNIFAAGILGILVADTFIRNGGATFQGLDRIDGIVLMSYFVIFLYYAFGRSGIMHKTETPTDEELERIDIPKTFLKIAGGMLGLFLGGRWIVDGAVDFATLFGVSQSVIALTIVAFGTSLPELAASIIAARKGSVDIAVGNVVGSNLFNIFWVLGLSAFINPLPFSNTLEVTVWINIAVAVLLFAMLSIGKYKHQISRREGYIFVGLYIAYIVFEVTRSSLT